MGLNPSKRNFSYICSNGNRSTGRGTAKRKRSSPGQVFDVKITKDETMLPESCQLCLLWFCNYCSLLILFPFGIVTYILIP